MEGTAHTTGLPGRVPLQKPAGRAEAPAACEAIYAATAWGGGGPAGQGRSVPPRAAREGTAGRAQALRSPLGSALVVTCSDPLDERPSADPPTDRRAMYPTVSKVSRHKSDLSPVFRKDHSTKQKVKITCSIRGAE